MKASKFTWSALLLITGFACFSGWLIKVKDDLRAVPCISASYVSYDPYINEQNRCDNFLIPASKSR
jgi:hypothetical protein